MLIRFETKSLIDGQPCPPAMEYDNWADAEQGWSFAKMNHVEKEEPFVISKVIYERDGQQVTCSVIDDFAEYKWLYVWKTCVKFLGKHGDETVCTIAEHECRWLRKNDYKELDQEFERVKDER